MNKENRKKEEEEPTYTEKYFDDEYEYRYGPPPPLLPRCCGLTISCARDRHVFLPKRLVDKMPRNEKGELRLMTEDEWRDLGVTQSHGWEHYLVHAPEPHILLFRRELNYTALYGNVPRKQAIKAAPAPAASADGPKKSLTETNAMVY
jgi:hypothetical protein